MLFTTFHSRAVVKRVQQDSEYGSRRCDARSFWWISGHLRSTSLKRKTNKNNYACIHRKKENEAFDSLPAASASVAESSTPTNGSCKSVLPEVIKNSRSSNHNGFPVLADFKYSSESIIYNLLAVSRASTKAPLEGDKPHLHSLNTSASFCSFKQLPSHPKCEFSRLTSPVGLYQNPFSGTVQL